MNFFQLFRIFSRFLAEFESDVYVLVLFEQGDDSLHRRDFAAVGFDDLDELADREDQYHFRPAEGYVSRNLAQVELFLAEFLLGEFHRGHMGRRVERIGARQFVIAHLGTECAVFAECDRTCAGLDAHRLVDLVELAFDGTFERRSPELAQQVVAFEFYARSGVVPCPDQRILGQFAVCRLVCGLRRGLFQCFLPVLCRRGAACEQQ